MTVCLTMIVKNEAHVIQRCLNSVIPFIDTWVIVDTGSTDGTQKIVSKCLSKIPGELVEREWVDFSFNRNQSLELAKKRGDYLLFIDADEELIAESISLQKSCYAIEAYGESLEMAFQKDFLIRSDRVCEWRGKVHEMLHHYEDVALLQGAYLLCRQDGQRSKDPKKYLRDAELLRKEIQDNPSNTRAQFYLAQSYYSAEEYQRALLEYELRAQMGGCPQEVYFSLYSIGRLQEALCLPPDQFLASYWRAYLFRPTRREPIYRMIVYLNRKNPALSYELIQTALAIPKPTDGLYVEMQVYGNHLPLLLADHYFYTGQLELVKKLYAHLLENVSLSIEEKEVIFKNMSILNQMRF